MALPLKPPVLPQLARSRGALPSGDGWAYEPKWDGFRCIAFIHGDGHEEFDLLGQRIHPAASRVAMLAEKTPATYVAFDLLARDDDVLLELPYLERRGALEAFVADPVELTPMVRTA